MPMCKLSYFCIQQVLFKREVNNSDDVTALCTCKRFEQYGLLCRHIFFVFRLFRVNNFPKNYIMKRWTKDVVPNEINHSFDTADFGDEKSKQVLNLY